MFIADPKATYRRASLAAGVALASTACVAGAVFLEKFVGVQPCHLCLLQRWPHYVGILLAAAALGTAHRGRMPSAGFLAAAAATFAVGAAMALHHTGVEAGWWAGPAGCTGALLPPPGSAETFFETLQGTPPAVACDKVSFRILGLSLANWNLAACLGLSAAAARGAWQGRAAAPATA